MFILIMTLMTYNGGQTISTAEFSSQETCISAANTWITSVNAIRKEQRISAVCTKR